MGKTRIKQLKKLLRESISLLDRVQAEAKEYDENKLVKENLELKMIITDMQKTMKEINGAYAQKTAENIVANAYKEYFKGVIKNLIEKHDNKKFFKNPVVQQLKEALASVEIDEKVPV